MPREIHLQQASNTGRSTEKKAVKLPSPASSVSVAPGCLMSQTIMSPGPKRFCVPEIGAVARKGRMTLNSCFIIVSFHHSHFHPKRLLPANLPPLLQPFAKRRRKSLRIHLQARLDFAVSHRQRVVKFRRARKIAHAERIQPLQRRRLPLLSRHHLHAKFLRIHERSIAPTLKQAVALLATKTLVPQLRPEYAA